MLVTRNRIPEDEYNSWNTQGMVGGSDSDNDRDQMSEIDVERQVGNTDNHGDTASEDEFDKPLASSVGNLSLLDLPNSPTVTKAKGKGRYIPRTPQKPSVYSSQSLRTMLIMKLGLGKRGRQVYSSEPESPSQRAKSKKIKARSSQHDHTVCHSFARPQISAPPQFVPLSADDMVVHRRGDDQDGPEIINPWEDKYHIPFLSTVDDLF